MTSLFSPGDLVHWPTRDGWQSGRVVSLDLSRIPVRSTTGRTHDADSVQLTIRMATGRVIRRDIRGCAGTVPGPHVLPSSSIAEAS